VRQIGVIWPIPRCWEERTSGHDPGMVHKRHFFHVPGYDPYDAASQHRRFVRETGRFQATWNVSVAVSELRDPSAGEGHWTVTTAAPGWKVETSYEILDWHDIVRADLDGSGPRRLWSGLVTFVDFIVSGAVRRYFAANWRYAMFFFVPFVDVILFAAVAIAAGWIAAPCLGIPRSAVSLRSWSRCSRSGCCCAGRGALAGRPRARRLGLRPRLHAATAFRRRGPGRGLRRPPARPRPPGGVDEIIIAGHSLGATIVIDVLARALARDPDLGRHGPSSACSPSAPPSPSSRCIRARLGARRRAPRRRGAVAALGRVPGARRRHQLSQIPSGAAHAIQRRQ